MRERERIVDSITLIKQTNKQTLRQRYPAGRDTNNYDNGSVVRKD